MSDQERALTVISSRALSTESLRQWTRDLDEMYRALMQEGTDYGIIPGTPKPSLYKPGAELLALRLGLRWKTQELAKTEDREAGFYEVEIRVDLFDESGESVGDGVGSANSWEKKYRYRYEGDGDARHRVINEDWAEQRNTILKMAKKRAFVDGILQRTGASRIFTQDLEDLELTGDHKKSPKTNGPISPYYCQEHKTEWFKRGKMKNFAHPTADTGEGPGWCNMPTEKPAQRPAAPAEYKPVASEVVSVKEMTVSDFWAGCRELGYETGTPEANDIVFRILGVSDGFTLKGMGYRVALDKLRLAAAKAPTEHGEPVAVDS